MKSAPAAPRSSYLRLKRLTTPSPENSSHAAAGTGTTAGATHPLSLPPICCTCAAALNGPDPPARLAEEVEGRCAERRNAADRVDQRLARFEARRLLARRRWQIDEDVVEAIAIGFELIGAHTDGRIRRRRPGPLPAGDVPLNVCP